MVWFGNYTPNITHRQYISIQVYKLLHMSQLYVCTYAKYPNKSGFQELGMQCLVHPQPGLFAWLEQAMAVASR